MTSKDHDSRMQRNKTDNAIQDYLSDIWGSPAEQDLVDYSCHEEQNDSLKANQISEKLLLDSSPPSSKLSINIELSPKHDTRPIAAQYSLILTIKLSDNAEEQVLRSQVESMLILLTCLYFLRRPLPPKVRRFILILSEQAIDDFNAAYWIQLPTSLVGANHEV